jgi:hypothetical protein
MNYRRGFQRIYAVLTVAWVAGILLLLPTDRLDFWREVRTNIPKATDKVQIQMPPGCDSLHRLVVEEWVAAHPNANQDEFLKEQQAPRKNGSNFTAADCHDAFAPCWDQSPASRPDDKCSELEIFKRVEEKLVEANENHLAKPTWIYEHLTLAVPIESRLQRFLCLLSLLLLPPALGYAAFFYVAPWVFRGFKSPRLGSVPVE